MVRFDMSFHQRMIVIASGAKQSTIIAGRTILDCFAFGSQ